MPSFRFRLGIGTKKRNLHTLALTPTVRRGPAEEPALATCSLHFTCSCYSLLTCLGPCAGVHVCIARMLVPEVFMGCLSLHHSFNQLVWNIKAIQNHARNQGNAASGFKQAWIATRGTGRRIQLLVDVR